MLCYVIFETPNVWKKLAAKMDQNNFFHFILFISVHSHCGFYPYTWWVQLVPTEK